MNLHKAVLRGSLWTVSMRWGIRGLGMISVVVLARLLRPEDFAIVAMAMILVAAMAIFAELGVTAMLIRDADITREDMDTAWTIKIIQGFVVGALVVALAHPLANYFREPRAVDVVYVCALALVLHSFENIGVVMFRKELDFAKDFRYEVLVKVVGVIATISLAVWLRSYWALAFGKIATSLTEIVLSYAMHPFRPRLSLARYRRFLGFSVATILTSAAKFISSKTSSFMVGSIGTPAQMGAFNVAAELSTVAPSELTLSISRAMFPTLARLRHDRAELAKMFLQIVATIATICLPMGIGMWAVTDDLVPVVLGSQWDASRQLMKFLTISGMLAALNTIMLGPILIITGHHHRMAGAQWVRCSVIVACALAGSRFGVEGIAFATMIGAVTMFAFSMLVLRSTLGCTARQFAACLWRPALSALVMGALVSYAAHHLAIAPPIRLATCIVLGIATYPVILAALWFVSGRPAGLEASIFSTLKRRLRRTG